MRAFTGVENVVRTIDKPTDQRQYAAQTRHYNSLTKKGWRIVRSYSSYWMVTRGQSAWNGFAEWSDALAACEAMAAVDAVVVH